MAVRCGSCGMWGGEAEGAKARPRVDLKYSLRYFIIETRTGLRRHDTARSWVDDKSHQEAGHAMRCARAFVLTHLCVVVTSEKYRVHGTRVSTVVCRALYFTVKSQRFRLRVVLFYVYSV